MSVQVKDAAHIAACISGISGSGKTTLFEKLILREARDAKWIFLYDHKHGDLAQRFKVRACFNEMDFLEAVQRGGFVIFNPAKHFAGKPEEGFKFFSSLVWDVCPLLKGRKIFGADELDALVDNRSEPEELCKILDQGRTFQIECYFIAQAMNGIHNQVRKQFKEIFVFMQGDANGMDWLIQQGFDEKEMQKLRHGEWLYKNKNTGATARGGKKFVPKKSERNLTGL